VRSDPSPSRCKIFFFCAKEAVYIKTKHNTPHRSSRARRRKLEANPTPSLTFTRDAKP
jgi:hypothetical protein